MPMYSLVPPARRRPAGPAGTPEFGRLRGPLRGSGPGLGLSLAAHVALVVAVTARAQAGPAGDPARPTAAGPAPDEAPAGEMLHWVGIDASADGSRGGAAPAARPKVRPPLAFVVPGRDAAHPAAAGALRGGPGSPGTGSDQGAPRPRALAPDTRAATALRIRVARLAGFVVPQVAVPAAEVARIVAGVVASAPDLARRVSRPEDFVPAPFGGALTQAGSLATVGWRPETAPTPIPLATNPLPEYPAGLARAGVTGRVVVEFLIDSTGLVDAGSLRVVEAAGSAAGAFTESVRQVLPRLRFVPGQLGERAVGVTVRQPFLFVVRQGAYGADGYR